ncbi:hypothetical protein [Kitasatospora sp. GAS204B]|uniref:hypothetical protein n=1 Tax=unclassified Kitasatospora TaxID=2633591 RepID=UPI00247356EA|nr:hypothetical protein [Kitasatospora sp. GAS204B]MDH6119784.1 hypothetical protein [Kitasatospora sp. GAS204B]
MDDQQRYEWAPDLSAEAAASAARLREHEAQIARLHEEQRLVQERAEKERQHLAQVHERRRAEEIARQNMLNESQKLESERQGGWLRM